MAMPQIDRMELKIILRELERALDADGDAVEFGCYRGDTSLELARAIRNTNKQLWLYDSFEGLPEKSNVDCSSAGEAFQLGELKATKVALVNRFRKTNLPLPSIKKGWFSELTNQDLPEKICFAFLDGDFYLSIKDSLRLIQDKLTAGAIIVVDDYQSEALPGVRQAVNEWLIKNPRRKLRVEKSLAIISI